MALIKIIFPDRFPHPDKYLRGISAEYLSGCLELIKEEATRSFLCHNIFLYVTQTKKLSQFLVFTVIISS